MQGPVGATGATGSTGATGPSGATGPTGPVGVVTVRSTGANQVLIVVDCGAGNHAVGGGALSAKQTSGAATRRTRSVIPVSAGTTNPRFWSATFDNNTPSNIAYAMCEPN